MAENSPKPIIKVAPCSLGRRFTWRVTLPKTDDVSGRVECNSREVAMRFARFAADLYGWQIEEWTPTVELPPVVPVHRQETPDA